MYACTIVLAPSCWTESPWNQQTRRVNPNRTSTVRIDCNDSNLQQSTHQNWSKTRLVHWFLDRNCCDFHAICQCRLHFEWLSLLFNIIRCQVLWRCGRSTCYQFNILHLLLGVPWQQPLVPRLPKPCDGCRYDDGTLSDRPYDLKAWLHKHAHCCRCNASLCFNICS